LGATIIAPVMSSQSNCLFDLVFAFALSQLSHHLLSQVTWGGGAPTAVLLCAVFGVWAYTSFQATVLGPERSHAQRALLAVMFVGLVMNAAIGHAFTYGAWSFVIPLLACQFGDRDRGTWTVVRNAPSGDLAGSSASVP
ncbi:MAG: low temperature requirement protein A, partial [Pseudonocardiaceae bacterium]